MCRTVTCAGVHDVHSMDAIAVEAPHVFTRTEPAEQERCDHSYSCQRSPRIKLELTVDTENDEKLARAASALRRNCC